MGTARMKSASPGGSRIPVHRRTVTRTRSIGDVACRHLGPRYRGDAPHAAIPGQARSRRGLEDAEASTPGDQRHRLALRANRAPTSSVSVRPPLAGCLPPIVARTSGACFSRTTAAPCSTVASATARATSRSRSSTKLRSTSSKTNVVMQRTADWARGLTCLSAIGAHICSGALRTLAVRASRQLTPATLGVHLRDMSAMDMNSSDQSIDTVSGCVKGVNRDNAESPPICRPFRLEAFGLGTHNGCSEPRDAADVLRGSSRLRSPETHRCPGDRIISTICTLDVHRPKHYD